MEITTPRGTKDIFGNDAKKIQKLIFIASKIFENFGCEQIITPTFESTSLFTRGIGEGTDIVEKEMYTFLDKGGRSLTLKPEGTAAVVRSYIQHNMHRKGLKKFYYHGPMFRYERPQAGRYREFRQIGIEYIGSNSEYLDAELIYLGKIFLDELKIKDVEIQINTIGCPDCRKVYVKTLKDFIAKKVDSLCSDCKERYIKSPLRVLDCKNETCQKKLKNAPNLHEYLDEKCKIHYANTKKQLDFLGVKYIENQKLVRGLDYYTNTVFEFITTKLGTQGTVLAGGRYNGLIKEISSKLDIPAIGFAAGLERLSMLMPDIEDVKNNAFICWMGEKAKEMSYKLMMDLRFENIKTNMIFEEKSLKAQLRKAEKNSSKYVVIIGDREMANNKYILKNFETRSEETLTLNDLMDRIKGL